MKSKSSRREVRAALKTDRAGDAAKRADDFLIVAIGASAGGIEAFIELLRNLPVDTGMAFVFIQHLDPKHHSILTELLSKETRMSVAEVTHGMRVTPNHVYVIPPNSTMSIEDHALQLRPREESHGTHMSIDHFMRTLAEEAGNRAVGVILSGIGSDGTLGLAEIQAQGGVTFAQDEATAKYDGMPRSAIAAGGTDYVLPPKAIARELARIAHHPYVKPDRIRTSQGFEGDERAGIHTIFQILRRATGVDFSCYRQTTILRRIERRMVVHKIDELEEYVKYIQTNPAEVKALYQDMLINVTSFFRNSKVFDALKLNVFPGIVKNRPPNSAIRMWTPGCASGEETCSLAITLLEFLGDKSPNIPIQLFGTDVSEASISKARNGLYPENIQGDVSQERLRRFFMKVENSYRISMSIRDLCIFAQHNILDDPPFSQMDVICCRNLLIYFEPALQNKVISLFHYAIRPGGYLVLGTSEGVGAASNLFHLEDRTNKIFSKKTTVTRQVVTFSLNRQVEQDKYRAAPAILAKQPEPNWNYLEAQKEFDRRLLTQYAPAAVFINEDMEIIHTRGNVNRYLKLAPGRASLDILKMAREGLQFDLRNAITRAKKENTAVRRQNISIKNGNGNGGAATGAEPARILNFEVIPLSIGNLQEKYFLIVFEDSSDGKLRKPGSARRGPAQRESKSLARRIGDLDQELAATKEYLQAVIETHEATNEELQSTNEELQSTNEELQSTNEELETAKEELQSANEELSTVNDELRNRNSEITQVNNDLTNLLSSINIAVVMVARDLTIRRFTPEAQKILGLIPTDIGRPILNINFSIDIPDFKGLVTEVMSTLRTVEKQAKDRTGIPYQVRVLPYRTLDNKADGCVITLVDVSPAAKSVSRAVAERSADSDEKPSEENRRPGQD